MDAYLPKPINARELVTLVESLAKATDPAFMSQPVASNAERTPPPPTAFDFAAALDRLGGDVDILKSQMTFLLNDAAALLDQIESDPRSSDPDSLKIAAHRLKGLTASYDATQAAALASQLETKATTCELNDAIMVAEERRRPVDDLLQAIKAYLEWQQV